MGWVHSHVLRLVMPMAIGDLDLFSPKLFAGGIEAGAYPPYELGLAWPRGGQVNSGEIECCHCNPPRAMVVAQRKRTCRCTTGDFRRIPCPCDRSDCDRCSLCGVAFPHEVSIPCLFS